MILPSKELLSAVLGCEVVDSIIGENTIWPLEFSKRGNMKLCICNKYIRGSNIYELAYKCKEWAGDLGYIVDSNLVRAYGCSASIVRLSNILTIGDKQEIFRAERECDAIFKACEWILNVNQNT